MNLIYLELRVYGENSMLAGHDRTLKPSIINVRNESFLGVLRCSPNNNVGL